MKLSKNICKLVDTFKYTEWQDLFVIYFPAFKVVQIIKVMIEKNACVVKFEDGTQVEVKASTLSVFTLSCGFNPASGKQEKYQLIVELNTFHDLHDVKGAKFFELAPGLLNSRQNLSSVGYDAVINEEERTSR